MKGERRALSHLGGEIETAGDASAARLLAAALSSISEAGARAHVHAFHSYPARLHPDLARGLVSALAPAGGVVLDPFAGSGTVLVEARLLGRAAVGSDLNPLAVSLARLKVTGRDAARRDRLVAAARRVADVATARRKQRAGASRRYPREDVELFAPHVLLALDALRVGIEADPDAEARGDLWLVLSSILTKLARRRGDSSDQAAEKQLARSFPARLFVMRAEELAGQLGDLERALPPGAPPPRVLLSDARELGPVDDRSVDLAVSSPPYPGNYDYLSHHRDRLRWLGLDARQLDRGELGARRHLSPDPARAVDVWTAQLTASLVALRRVLRADGAAALVLADSAVGRVALLEDELVARAAPRAGLALVARASQPRPHCHAASAAAFGARPRREHVLLLAGARRR
ncbi:MAG: hypothetical protein IT374_26795 [Polyangiaceae bacterium]|nr:hypothetical protein [Polyangiaceae bacterium]